MASNVKASCDLSSQSDARSERGHAGIAFYDFNVRKGHAAAILRHSPVDRPVVGPCANPPAVSDTIPRFSSLLVVQQEFAVSYERSISQGAPVRRLR